MMLIIKTLCVLWAALLVGGCAASVPGPEPEDDLRASFRSSPATPSAGQTVTFTDTSTGGPTSWRWDFGDGATSASQNPSHSFATPGTRTVTLTVGNATGSAAASKSLTVITGTAILINHETDVLADIPSAWIDQARQTLHIAYGHTSHGSQLTTGMTGLVGFKGTPYSWNFGGTGGALDLREWDYGVGFGSPDTTTYAIDLGNPDRSAWAQATREYLDRHDEINVIIWAWCWQVNATEPEIQIYLDLMSQLESEYPDVRFVYQTGRVNGGPETDGYHQRNQQIRDFCVNNGKVLYDFADIESYDPDDVYYGDKLVTDNCDYDSDGDGVVDRNWAIDWQNAHPGQWYECGSAHSQPLNANVKAYAAWWLWARLAGWDGR